jgi:hypothetical protein
MAQLSHEAERTRSGDRRSPSTARYPSTFQISNVHVLFTIHARDVNPQHIPRMIDLRGVASTLAELR